MNSALARLILIMFLASLVIGKRTEKKSQKNRDFDDDDQENNEKQIGMQPNSLDSSVIDMIWCGSDTVITDDEQEVVLDQEKEAQRQIFVLSDKGTVYRSVDHGFNWVNINDQVFKSNQDQLNKTGIPISTMQVHLYDTQIVYFFGSNGASFKTSDCGQSFQMFTHDDKFQNFQLNRAKENSILASIPLDCDSSGENQEECESENQEIYVSQDGGQNWKRILKSATDAAWDRLVHYALVPDDRIIASYKLKYANKYVPAVAYSDDNFETSMIICEQCVQYYQTDFFLFLLVREIVNEEQNFKIKISPAYGGDYKPKDINIPVKRMKDHGFTILDTQEGQIFISMNHEEDDIRIGNIYVSDFRGFDFSLSLPQSIRDSEGVCDFEKISSTEGVYISNIFDSKEIEASKKRRGESNTQKGGKSETFDHYRKTVVSYNYGGSWHPLKAPQTDYKGNDYQCTGQCSLHLKGRSQTFGSSIYSRSNAPGVILATGNVGMYLTEQNEDLNTYLSRDGGQTWYEIKQQSHIYQIGDHGGIIVMARDDKSTNQIIYSWNQGQTWDEIILNLEKFEITSIVTEPGNIEQRFLVYGQQNRNGTSHGVVIALDFSSMHQRICSGAWEPGTKDSDYEFWVPTDFHGEKCLFGRKMKYIRRKRSSQCFNSEEYDTQYYVESCPCTEEDWECDLGYMRETEDGPCTPISTRFKTKLNMTPPQNCDGFYEIPSGYKKIPGDYCDGGVDRSPERVQCPEVEKSDSDQQEIPDSQINYSVYREEDFKQFDELKIKNDQKRKELQLQKDLAEGKTRGFFSSNLIYAAVAVLLVIVLLKKNRIINCIWNICRWDSLGRAGGLPISSGGGPKKGYQHLSLFQNDDDHDSL